MPSKSNIFISAISFYHRILLSGVDLKILVSNARFFTMKNSNLYIKSLFLISFCHLLRIYLKTMQKNMRKHNNILATPSLKPNQFQDIFLLLSHFTHCGLFFHCNIKYCTSAEGEQSCGSGTQKCLLCSITLL